MHFPFAQALLGGAPHSPDATGSTGSAEPCAGMGRWRLDHVGHAVLDLEEAVQFYQTALGYRVKEREEVISHAVDVVFMEHPGGECPLIELLSPRSENVTLQQFLQKRGPGLHHLCYEVDSVESELTRLKALGMTPLDEHPRMGSRQMLVAFFHPRSALGILLEICTPAAELGASRD